MSILIKALKKVLATTLPKGYTSNTQQEDLKDAYNYAASNLKEDYPDLDLPEFWEENEISPKNIKLIFDKITLQDPEDIQDISAFTNQKPGWLLTIPKNKWASALKQEYDREFQHIIDLFSDNKLPPAITIENEFGDGRARCLFQYAQKEKIPVVNFKIQKKKKNIRSEHILTIANNYKLKKSGNDWALLDPQGEVILTKFINMYHYEKDPSGVLSLQHPQDLPQELRGKGLGVSSYLALAKYYGKIRSDTALTPDGEKVWKRLLSDGATVISWDTEYSSEEEAFKKLDRYYGDVSPNAFYDPDTYFVRFELRG